MRLGFCAFGQAPSNGQVPVHGPWTYGDHCGAGSMGSDIDSTDAACHVHDDCYDAIHLTADRPPELSLCLQGGYVWYCGEYGGCLAGQDGNGVGGTQYIPPPAKLATLSCVQSALAKGAASTAIDAVGLLPEGGAVAGAFSLWHGAAGVSNGIKILQRGGS
jgi:hypothetical protein